MSDKEKIGSTNRGLKDSVSVSIEKAMKLHKKNGLSDHEIREAVAVMVFDAFQSTLKIGNPLELLDWAEQAIGRRMSDDEISDMVKSSHPRDIGCGDPNCKTCGPLINQAKTLQHKHN